MRPARVEAAAERREPVAAGQSAQVQAGEAKERPGQELEPGQPVEGRFLRLERELQ